MKKKSKKQDLFNFLNNLPEGAVSEDEKRKFNNLFVEENCPPVDEVYVISGKLYKEVTLEGDFNKEDPFLTRDK